MLSFFYKEPAVTVDLLANEKQKVTREILPSSLALTTEILEALPIADWTHDRLLATFQAAAKERGFKLGQLLWPLRVALTGLPYSPGATEVAVALGKELTLKRLEKARKITV
jgi:glutamyl-tRNA synthetase